MHYMMYDHYGFSPFGFILSGILHIVLLGIFVGFMIWLFRSYRGRHWHAMQGPWQSHSAITILNERYAKGEISKDEYAERKKTLLGQ